MSTSNCRSTPGSRYAVNLLYWYKKYAVYLLYCYKSRFTIKKAQILTQHCAPQGCGAGQKKADVASDKN